MPKYIHLYLMAFLTLQPNLVDDFLQPNTLLELTASVLMGLINFKLFLLSKGGRRLLSVLAAYK